MPVISDSLFMVRLPSGNRAVYSVQPHQLIERPGSTLTQRAIDYGEQIAHELAGQWYRPGGWVEITDARTVALLERNPWADEPATLKGL